MNLCNLLASVKSDILITFVITEEWLSFIGSEAKMDNIRFATIPNVIPSEKGRADNMDAFFEAIMTKMECPFKQLLDELESPPTVIVVDTFLSWAVSVGNRRNIRTALFWPMSATQFTTIQYFHLFVENGHFPVDLSEKGNERVDYIPGVSSTRFVDFMMNGSNNPPLLGHILKSFSWVPKAHYFIVTSIYELETRVIDVLRSELSLPIYTIGPLIPSFKPISPTGTNHLQWLDSQPCSSVLYISTGSFLSFSRAQMDEIVAGLNKSGVRFFWVARGETNRLQQVCGDMGFVVPWCDQLRVLGHSSVGGFWTHCGWNSVREAIFAGVPLLTFPIGFDQGLNSKLVVEDWKIGWRVKSTEAKIDHLVTSDEIASLVKKIMNLGDDEGKEMRRRITELQQILQGAIKEGGSSQTNINAFIRGILQDQED
ncbi:PREDICTED: UDP-glycosyltransferase 87A1-like [Fragaria vesca subsp. vesca]